MYHECFAFQGDFGSNSVMSAKQWDARSPVIMAMTNSLAFASRGLRSHACPEFPSGL